MQTIQIINATLPAQNLHQIEFKRSNFKCQQSPLNPNYTSTLTKHSQKSTKLHLSNLEKLLGSTPTIEPAQESRQLQPVSKNGLQENRGKVLLEGLNLARLWPQVKSAAEDMSPRHLNRLQRLLSKTIEYSPRNGLGSRWREYHGSRNWEGLLDPLDENLRREVVRYGEFVQAAYHAFHSDPAMSTEEAPLPRHVAMPDRTYKVTKSLYATSSVGLPKWVDDVAPDLGWMTQRSSWIGYVAVCDDKREIQRMGRRDIVIALRGTATCLEWAENVRAQLVEMSESEPDNSPSRVESGFWSLYKTRGAHVPSLAESVNEEIRRLVELYKGENLSITVTGHSLGAALALLVADGISSTCASDVGEEMPPVAVFSFGGPRVGDKGFANRIESNNVKVLRIVNNQDLITQVPGVPMGGGIMGDMMQMGYSHVGAELRVDTKMSPFLKPDADVACCHDLEAYLHLVDGFLASNCPFRSNAKRSLVKLIHEQGSNVKKLYTSKANALSLNLERQRSFSAV
ncbi:hypothetical protein ACFE04_027084 [Oxalis oulophora]